MRKSTHIVPDKLDDSYLNSTGYTKAIENVTSVKVFPTTGYLTAIQSWAKAMFSDLKSATFEEKWGFKYRALVVSMFYARILGLALRLKSKM